MSRSAIRDFLLALTTVLITAFAAAQNSATAPTTFNEASVAQLEEQMNAGTLTSVQLVHFYLQRIFALDQNGVNAIIQLNPDALTAAANADAMRRSGKRLPLLGIPVLLKDNIDTGDKMATSAGSLALCNADLCASAQKDSTVAANLRAAGAVILGKTNLSEWANFRSFFSTSGWSGRGGLTHNPYSLDRNACGSSSGSGAAASANFTAISFGSETDGSIVCPANVNGVVGIKPTVGLVSRGGVVPISHNQDTVGPHTRTVADAAMALNAVISRTPDLRDPYTAGVPLGWEACSSTSGVACSPNQPLAGKSRPNLVNTDYTKFLNPRGLNGATVGMTRSGIDSAPAPPQVQMGFYAAMDAIGAAGAHILDLDGADCVGLTTSACANLATPVNFFANNAGSGEFLVLLYDFKNDLAAYFATRVNVPVAGGTLGDAINFNNANAAAEMPYFGQEIFEAANSLDTTDPTATQPVFGISYNNGLKADQLLGANIDSALSTFHLDAIVAPTDSPAWTTDLLLSDHFLFASSGLAGPPGYPIINVPAANVLGLPMGVSFIGTAFSEPTLIKLASGFEAATHARFMPTFTGDVTKANTSGTTLVHPPKTSVPKKAPHHM